MPYLNGLSLVDGVLEKIEIVSWNFLKSFLNFKSKKSMNPDLFKEYFMFHGFLAEFWVLVWDLQRILLSQVTGTGVI